MFKPLLSAVGGIGIMLAFVATSLAQSPATFTTNNLNDLNAVMRELESRGYHSYSNKNLSTSSFLSGHSEIYSSTAFSVIDSADHFSVASHGSAMGFAVAPASSLSSVSDAMLLLKAVLQGGYIQRQYGDNDDRHDKFNLNPTLTNSLQRSEWNKVAQSMPSVAAIFSATDLVDNHDGTFSLPSTTLRNRRNLCAGERFADQPCGALGSAFLVGSNLMVTAGHCVGGSKALPHSAIRFVFGYEMTDSNHANLKIPAKDIYKLELPIPPRNIRLVEGEPGADWAVLKLDRPCDRASIHVYSGTLATNTGVYCVGYPCGLPEKITGGARILTRPTGKYFTTDLDVFTGNSGGPILNSDGVVIGLVSVGGADFLTKEKNGCNTIFIDTNSYPEGVTCTSASEFSHLIP